MIWTKRRVYKLIPVFLLIIGLVLIGKIRSNKKKVLLDKYGILECVILNEMKDDYPFRKVKYSLFVENTGEVSVSINTNIKDRYSIGDTITIKYLQNNYNVNLIVKKGCIH